MSANYTQYDWASDRWARDRWADEEDRLLDGIDSRMNKKGKKGKRFNA